MSKEMLAEQYMKNRWPHHAPGSIEYAIYYVIYIDGIDHSDGKEE